MRCPNCNKEMSDFIDVYKCCHCDLQIEKTITEQQKIDELNQKWLEAIKDWKKIIAEKDHELTLYKKALELACSDVKDVVCSWLEITGGELPQPLKVKNESYYLKKAKEQNAFEDRREIYKLAEGWEDEE